MSTPIVRVLDLGGPPHSEGCEICGTRDLRLLMVGRIESHTLTGEDAIVVCPECIYEAARRWLNAERGLH